MFGFTRRAISAFLPIVATLCAACGSVPEDAGPASDTASTPASARAAAANRAPSIDVPTESHARAGQPFSFQPAAADADGDSLRFSAQNLPPWISIDPATGVLTGTPGAADAGVHEDIRILVADAAHSTRSSSFSITVLDDAMQLTGSATLTWELPPSKLDGAPLDDLAGYRILFGRDSGNLDRSVLIDDPTVTSFEFTELPSGIWYFAVVAVNAGGLEGPPTTITMKSI
jgi:hypothetical protein